MTATVCLRILITYNKARYSCLSFEAEISLGIKIEKQKNLIYHVVLELHTGDSGLCNKFIMYAVKCSKYSVWWWVTAPSILKCKKSLHSTFEPHSQTLQSKFDPAQ